MNKSMPKTAYFHIEPKTMLDLVLSVQLLKNTRLVAYSFKATKSFYDKYLIITFWYLRNKNDKRALCVKHFIVYRKKNTHTKRKLCESKQRETNSWSDIFTCQH